MNKLKPINSSLLKKQKNICHGFFTRNGGVSLGVFNSLNCSFNSKDTFKNVEKNREIICLYHNQNIDKLKTISQIHSNKVLIIKNYSMVTSKINADAIITNFPNLIIGILTADCAPVLLYDYKEKIIAAVHVGWRGAKNKIIKNTINKMNLMGSKSLNIIAAIGPCIGYHSYEVGTDLFELFLSENINKHIYFKKVKKNKYLFNLPYLIASQLLDLKVKKNNISISKHDTFKEEEKFFSNRRNFKNNEENCGRMLSTISIIDRK